MQQYLVLGFLCWPSITKCCYGTALSLHQPCSEGNSSAKVWLDDAMSSNEWEYKVGQLGSLANTLSTS